jgi:hypothetical protein
LLDECRDEWIERKHDIDVMVTLEGGFKPSRVSITVFGDSPSDAAVIPENFADG